MEAFSEAYLMAVCSVAGYALAKPVPDDDSVDFTISAARTSGLTTRPKLDIQLKATSAQTGRGGRFSFRLKQKNYDDLIVSDVLVPRILVVVRLPEELESWLRFTQRQMIATCSGYWLSLRGFPVNSNEHSTNVTIDSSQRLTPRSLQEVMGRIHRREPV